MSEREVKTLTVWTEFQQGGSRMVMMVSRISSPLDNPQLLKQDCERLPPLSALPLLPMDHLLGEHLTAKGQDDEIKSSHSWNKEKFDVAERGKGRADISYGTDTASW